MPDAFDPYPTRLHPRRDPLPRREPVVHGGAADRHRGPLDESQLARFERDGFLVLQGVFKPRQIEWFRDDLAACERAPEMLVPDSHDTFYSTVGYSTVGATPARCWDTSLKHQKVGVPELADLVAAIRTRGVDATPPAAAPAQ